MKYGGGNGKKKPAPKKPAPKKSQSTMSSMASMFTTTIGSKKK